MKSTLKILFVITILFCLACKKDIVETVPINNFQIPQELKDYIAFNSGSYWIYRDSISGNQDSLYVTQIESDSSYQSFNYGISTLSNRSIRIQYLDNFRSMEYDIQESQDEKINIDMTSESSGYGSVNHPEMVYPFNINSFDTYYATLDGYSSNYNDTCRLINKLQNYSVNNYIFNNVLEFKNSNNFFAESLKIQPTTYCYAPKVGIVQFKFIKSNKNYKLIRYHLN